MYLPKARGQYNRHTDVNRRGQLRNYQSDIKKKHFQTPQSTLNHHRLPTGVRISHPATPGFN